MCCITHVLALYILVIGEYVNRTFIDPKTVHSDKHEQRTTGTEQQQSNPVSPDTYAYHING
jgi:hypothetical protein